MTQEVLGFSRSLAAPAARVFEALTESRGLERWFCDACESDPRPGGALVMRWTRPGGSPEPFVARWLECEPTRQASFLGGHSGYPGGLAGVVTFELADEGARTKLDVVHIVPARDELAPMVATWRDAWPRALDRLERHLAASGDRTP